MRLALGRGWEAANQHIPSYGVDQGCLNRPVRQRPRRGVFAEQLPALAQGELTSSSHNAQPMSSLMKRRGEWVNAWSGPE